MDVDLEKHNIPMRTQPAKHTPGRVVIGTLELQALGLQFQALMTQLNGFSGTKILISYTLIVRVQPLVPPPIS